MGIVILVPALVAFTTILVTRKAALSLFLASLVGALLLHGGNLLVASKALVVEHLFPSLSGAWHIGPIIFTLLLGSFAQVLEKSGGFQSLLAGLLAKPSEDAQRRGLLSVYGLGWLCFFDGLANAVLVGRIARPMADTLRTSRQLLAYLIDSTSSAVACIAFISTWIATQLSLIREGVKGAELETEPVELFFSSIPANPYCWLVLWLLFLVIWKSWWIGPMRGYQNSVSEVEGGVITGAEAPTQAVLLPLLSIVITIPGMIYLWQDGVEWSWRNAFSGSAVPQAMVAGAVLSVLIACLCFPKSRRAELPKHLTDGAAGLLPALVVLIFAWTLGSVFKELQVAEFISQLLGSNVSLSWLPLSVFVIGACTSFLTGSSWGTMGLLMPLALPVTIELSPSGSGEELLVILPMVIGAVFGGAVFGDNCSPFSDTTIVTALATGCSPRSHVITQLPYALIAAGAATLAYVLMAVGAAAWLATLIACALLGGVVLLKASD
jgi:Na+/H+ antiporter NhaC